MADLEHIVARLRSQLSRAEPVLFLGAGFSMAAHDQRGRDLPAGRAFAQEIWNLGLPSYEYDSSANLADVFQAAKVRNPRELARVVRERLSVDSETLPDFYLTWFSAPWYRCYTLNIDDLEQGVSRRYALPRSLHPLSGTTDSGGPTPPGSLECVHLNGALWDGLDDLTFTLEDYANRLTRPDRWYDQCVADILARPVVFVGTELDEATLWQYVQFRKTRGGRGRREMRPGSCLVIPTINPARRALLDELHIDHVAMTAQQFAEEVLDGLQGVFQEGIREIEARADSVARRSRPRLVSDLASANPTGPTEYLLGQEPTWADLQVGRAIERDCDPGIYEAAHTILENPQDFRPLVITGTAGSGKSTSLMRLALRLSGEGTPVYWIDQDSNVDAQSLRLLVHEADGHIAFCVDDADIFGNMTTGWARELPRMKPNILFSAAARSSRISGLLDSASLGDVTAHEVSMPHLTDGDIGALLQVLDEANRLGVLKGLSTAERIAAFQREAGRQLLVAMIQATSGKRFTAKVFDEFSELNETQRLLYAIVSVVSSQRYTIDRDEILLACGDSGNVILNELEALSNRGVIIRESVHIGYKSRHRVIADEVVNGLRSRDMAESVVEGVCFAFSNKISPHLPREDRNWRRMIRFVNHEFLKNMAGYEAAGRIYTKLEPLLHWDYHYWLQRGALEVKDGDLGSATNFLDQARSLAPDDRLVRTEYAYMLMKKAAQEPSATSATESFEEGFGMLVQLIDEYGNRDAYPYHVLGSQSLSWINRAALNIEARRLILQRVIEIVREGQGRHPREMSLDTLEYDLRRALLQTAVE